MSKAIETAQQLQPIIADVITEVIRAEAKHPNWPTDIIYQAAILSEECGEAMREAVNVTLENGDIEKLKTELIQTMAMCLRMYKNLPEPEKPEVLTNDFRAWAGSVFPSKFNQEIPLGDLVLAYKKLSGRQITIQLFKRQLILWCQLHDLSFNPTERLIRRIGDKAVEVIIIKKEVQSV